MTLFVQQQRAIEGLSSGLNVVLESPTGSGKTLVGLFALFRALRKGWQAVYSVPTRALANDKFLDFAEELGADRVGLLTGEMTINRQAPVIVCTQEVLAGEALRYGESCRFAVVVMDEFHFYGDPDRGTAWQVPLIELPHAQFLLMSATLGDIPEIERDLHRRTGRKVLRVVAAEDDRPVRLKFEYEEDKLLDESISSSMERGLTPAYVVVFSQRRASRLATELGKDRTAESAGLDVPDWIEMNTPAGKLLKKALAARVGVHHAGILPKYRFLVEQLTRQGELDVIFGTETIGVGVNFPIRTVIFSQLIKFDAGEYRPLTVREFRQIAGRAGRKGFDKEGWVIAQAPEHEIKRQRRHPEVEGGARPGEGENQSAQSDVARWSRADYERYQSAPLEKLTPHLRVSHEMLLALLARPGSSRAAVRTVLLDNHISDPAARRRIRREAIDRYRALVKAGVVETLREPDPSGRRVRVKVNLDDEFALSQPLSLFALEMTDSLDQDSPSFATQVLSVVEASYPAPRLTRPLAEGLHARERRRLRTQGLGRDEIRAQLAEVDIARPLAEAVDAAFSSFRESHPWVSQTPEPKKIALELWERRITFDRYIRDYQLQDIEGLVLRYLSDVVQMLIQTLRRSHKTVEVLQMTAWLRDLVGAVDASYFDEWERLGNPGRESTQARRSAIPPS